MQQHNILTIFTGQQSQHLAYHFYHLQAEQLFDYQQNTPQINHKVIWKDLEKHLPKCLIYDHKGNIKLLEHQNRSNNKKIIAKLQGETVGIPLMGDLEYQINTRLKGLKNKAEEDVEEDKEWKQLFDNFDISQKSLVQLGKYSSKKEWELFYAGKNNTKRQDEMEKLIEPLRKQLEQEDYMEGFVLFGQIYNGFGSITQTLIAEIQNHCPKAPIMLTGILFSSTKEPTQVQLLNKLISYTSFLPTCDIFLPLNINSQRHPFFGESSNLHYKSLSPLISNIYYPFMTKNKFGQYVKNITQYRHNNLFNACYTVPIVQQQILIKQYNVMKYLSPNSTKLNYVRQLQNHIYKPTLQSFSQTYVLKGGYNIEPHQIPQNTYIDFKMTDIIFSQKEGTKFTQPYVETYGQNATAFPFHSVLFSNECLKGQILNVANTLKRIEPTVLQRYLSQGIQKDQLKQISNQMFSFYDNYDKKGPQSSDDD